MTFDETAGGRVSVVWTPAEVAQLAARDVSKALCVVIDVLRATTTMTAALVNGATGIVPVVTVEEARALAAGVERGALLCGERMGMPPEGFDLGNSPRDMTRERVGGRRMVHTTTNGTRALRACAGAAEVWAGCFWTLGAVASGVGAALASGRPVILVCAGSWEEYSHEDALFAGAVCDRAGVDHPVRSVWRGRTQPLTAALAATLNGRHLARIGLGADVEECARVDVLDHVPRVCGGVLGWPGGCPNSS